MMNCKRCHHTYEAHSYSSTSDDSAGSIMKVGGCIIPVCRCKQYVDPINEIDEELL